MENNLKNIIKEHNLKNVIILFLGLVLVFLIFKKFNKSNKSKENFIVKPNESFTNKMKSNLLNSSDNNIHPYPKINHTPNTNQYFKPEITQSVQTIQLNQITQSLYPEPNLENDSNYYNLDYENTIEPINSNVLQSNQIVTNMGDHELLHIDDSKPYLINDKIPLDNVVKSNSVIKTENDFKYSKDFNDIYGIELNENLYETV
jgi:hypothetical protein